MIQLGLSQCSRIENMKKINLFEPYWTNEDLDAVTGVIKSGWWKEGPICEKLEEEFCAYTKTKYAVSVNSATVGLDLIFKAYGIKNGEVILPALTFVATGLIPLYNDCKVIFADIDEATLTIDPKDVVKKITSKTKAIIVQHQSGYPVDLDSFEQFKKKGILVIEDAAHGAGTFYKGEHVGTRNPSVFSFNVVKNIAACEGGMVTTDNKDMAEKMMTLRWFGIDQFAWKKEKKKHLWDYSISMVGYKYHFNDIFASLARVQLKRLNKTNKKRKELAQRYNDNFLNRSLPVRILLINSPDIISSRHQYIIRVDEKHRDSLINWLTDHKIISGVHYKPINLYPIFGGHGHTPVTDREWGKMVTLPLHPKMTFEDVDHVCEVIARYFKQN